MLFHAAKYRKVTQINTESPGIVFAISLVPASLIEFNQLVLTGYVYFSWNHRIRGKISVFSPFCVFSPKKNFGFCLLFRLTKKAVSVVYTKPANSCCALFEQEF